MVFCSPCAAAKRSLVFFYAYYVTVGFSFAKLRYYRLYQYRTLFSVIKDASVPIFLHSLYNVLWCSSGTEFPFLCQCAFNSET